MSAGPFLVTPRLELWRPQLGDLDALAELVADEETRRFLGPPRDRPAEAERLMRNAGSWALYGYGTACLRLPGSPAIIGTCGVFHSWRGYAGMNDVAEAGWIIHREHAGRGYAREAMAAMLEWFDRTHGPVPVTCMIEAGNTASERLAAALGFVASGSLVLEDGVALGLFTRPAG